MSSITLYHAPSSYYSMIARFALIEANAPYCGRKMDIHFAKDQLSGWYAAINPLMTVPALADGETRLIDSAAILAYAQSKAGSSWQEPGPAINRIVEAHYTISIERLTFAHAMNRIPPLRFLLPRLLLRVCRHLERRAQAAPEHRDALLAKARLNHERIDYFTTGSLKEKLEIERQHVRQFVTSLPAPASNAWLCGDKLSAADIVVAVLLARLRMINEWTTLSDRPDIVLWFERISARPAFSQADIWTQFSLRRMLFQ
jgi:glutathione S-transferase